MAQQRPRRVDISGPELTRRSIHQPHLVIGANHHNRLGHTVDDRLLKSVGRFQIFYSSEEFLLGLMQLLSLSLNLPLQELVESKQDN